MFTILHIAYMKTLNDQIRVHPSTKKLIKSKSLTHDVNGKATESYDGIINRVFNNDDGEHK